MGPHTSERFLTLKVSTMYNSLGESGRSRSLNSQQIPLGINLEHLFPGSGLIPIITNHTCHSNMKDVESTITVWSPIVVSLRMMEGHTAYERQYYLSNENIGAPIAVTTSKRKKQVSQLIPWHVDITQARGNIPTTSFWATT